MASLPSSIAPQLPLGVQLRDDASLASFHVGPNHEVMACLEQAASGTQNGLIFLQGPSGSGKTHLLQAVCRAASAQGMRAGYLPLGEFADDEAVLLEGMAGLSLLCLDDIQAVASQQAWALQLMRLCDAARGGDVTLLLAADGPPASLATALPDLRTRLGWGMVFALQPLADTDRLQALQLRARLRGLDLPEEVGQFLLQRRSRDLPGLMRMLGELDTASLAAQRRLTIPFVKTVLGL